MFKPSSKYYSWPAPQIPSGTPPGLWTIPKQVLAEWVRMARMPKIQGHALSTYGNCKAISSSSDGNSKATGQSRQSGRQQHQQQQLATAQLEVDAS